ncbi:MAG: permease [Sphaerochaetaceae bacterium]|nr:permease [Sphaerochaetaceae bacterium]
MITTLVIYGILVICLIFSLLKSKEKTLKAFKVAGQVLKNSAPSLIAVLGLVGLTLGILSPETISRLLGEEAGLIGTLIAAVVGAITLIPSLIAFPLAGSLLRAGSTIMTVAAFITSLMMVGIVTAPMEIKYLGKRFTLMRNGFGFIAALLLAFLMGVIL